MKPIHEIREELAPLIYPPGTPHSNRARAVFRGGYHHPDVDVREALKVCLSDPNNRFLLYCELMEAAGYGRPTPWYDLQRAGTVPIECLMLPPEKILRAVHAVLVHGPTDVSGSPGNESTEEKTAE